MSTDTAGSSQLVDIDELAGWVASQRAAKGWSLEDVAYKLRDTGYPVSVNKIWRLEQGSSRVKRLDLELVMWLEQLFGSRFLSLPSPPQNISREAVATWMLTLAEHVDLAGVPPKDERLRAVWAEVIGEQHV